MNSTQFFFPRRKTFLPTSNIYISIIIFVSFFACFDAEADVLINEVCPINKESLLDDDHSNEDWIELYNSADTVVSLKNYRISNKNKLENAWLFPDTTIAPKGFLTLFASEKDRVKDNKYVLETSGGGLYYWVNPEGYSFVYKEISGDFTAKVHLTSFQNADFFANAGIMIRENLDNTSKFISLAAREYKVNPDVLVKYRDKNDTRIQRIELLTDKYFKYPDIYLVMERKGNNFTFKFTDISGFVIRTQSLTLDIKDNVFFGFQGNSKNTSMVSNIFFEDFYLNNEIIDPTTLNFFEINTGFQGKIYKNSTLHTNFKIKNSGDNLFLWEDGKLVDKLQIPVLLPDYTYGRSNKEDDLNNLNYSSPFHYLKSSPNQKNQEVFQGITDNPKVNFDNHFFDTEINISIEQEPNTIIKITTDGQNPLLFGKTFEGENLVFNNNTTLRVVAIKESYLPSQILTYTFLKNYNSQLPAVCLTIDSTDLYNNWNGLFYDILKNTKKSANVEYIDGNGDNYISQQVGVKVHGGISRVLAQKSFRLYASASEGKKEFDSSWVPHNSSYPVDRLVLKNGGQDYFSSKIRDAFAHQLLSKIGTLDYLEYKPVNLFFNGQYYGLSSIRERFDDNYLKNKYKINSEDLNLMADETLTKTGNGSFVTDYFNRFLALNPDDTNFIDSAKTLYNVVQFLDYVFFNTFIVNSDWNMQNHRTWNVKQGPLNFQVYDLDVSLGLTPNQHTINYFFNIIANKKNNSHYQIFLKLLENDSLKNYFVTRAFDQINTNFIPSNTIPILDSIASEIQNDITKQQEFFPESIPNWANAIDSIRFFLNVRPEIYKLNICEFLSMPFFQRTVNISFEEGEVQLNTIKLKSSFEARYLNNQKLTLTYTPPVDKKFKYWKLNDTIYSLSNYIEVVLNENINLVPVLEGETVETQSTIVINEIMHKSPENEHSQDWIELYNNSDKDVDLGNWLLFDEKEYEEFTFPSGVILKSNQYLVITKKTIDFININGKIPNQIGDFKFGLNAIDQVRLFDNNKNLVDSVSYSNLPPWPQGVYGTGATLELISPDLDNTKGENWQTSYEHNGTPGRKNSQKTTDIFPISDKVTTIFPNPNNGTFTIKVAEPQKIDKICIYDISGKQSFSQVITPSENTINIKTNLNKGVYIIEYSFHGQVKELSKVVIQ